MDFKEKVKKFLALSSTVLLTTLSEGVKAEEYSADKPLTQIAFNQEITKKDLKSIKDIIEERLHGAKNWIENGKYLEELLEKADFEKDKPFIVDNKAGTEYFLKDKGILVKTDKEKGYFIPFGSLDIKDLKGRDIKEGRYMPDVSFLGAISKSAKDIIEKDLIGKTNSKERGKCA